MFGGWINPELYVLAELGYYYGWGAVEAFKRGWIEDFREQDGRRLKCAFTLEEAVALCRAAQKVAYRKLLEEGDVMLRNRFVKGDRGNIATLNRNVKAIREKAK
jgi:hypothetical protein